jgi:cytoskeleton protein RodZ
VTYPEADQLNQLQAIGEKLSQARQAKGISLEEIATKTFIPLRLLTAIEAGKLDALPEPIFIQGFIKRFATEVGLDGPALAKEFEVAPPIAPVEVLHEPVEAIAEGPSERPAWLPLLGAGAALALLVGIGVALTQPQQKSSPPPVQAKSPAPASMKPVAPSPVAPSKVADASSKPAASPEASPRPIDSAAPSPAASPSPSASPTTTGTGPVEVKLNLTDESWVAIEADGKLEYEGILPKGTQKTWKAKEKIVVNTGNAGGVSASFNGSEAKPLGEAGMVAEMSYPPEPAPAN